MWSEKIKDYFKNSYVYYFLLIIFLFIALSVTLYEVLWRTPCGTEVILVNTKNNFPILVKQDDEYIGKELIEHNIYNDHISKALKQILKPGDTSLDIGAGYGYYSIIMSKLVQENGQVYSFEPIPDVYKLLSYSVKMNGANNVQTFEQLPYSQNIELFLNTYQKYLTLFSIANNKETFNDEHKLIEVNARTLDSVLPELKDVKLIKIDTNGSEVHAIKGASKIISNSPEISFIVSWHASKFAEYGEYFTKLIDNFVSSGFEFWMILPDGSMKLVHKDQLLHLEQTDVLITKLSIG